MPTHTATLARYSAALTLLLSATVALAMNPALLKRQIEAGDAGVGGNSYVRLITPEDWTVNQEENRLEALIEVPANASIEGRMIGRPSKRCEITTNAIAVSRQQNSQSRFYAAAQAQPWHLAVRAQPLSECNPNVLRAVLIAKDHTAHKRPISK
ncbi:MULTISPECIES: hypothetical protein [Salinisphaera]|mgnify:CR=1|uniref:hypothetical protein n=1 Tax=Salinisphaera TaxID=180541 RepID=UPI0011CE3243|nr:MULTISPECIES: hypothetical protein [Salinisphaera]